MRALAWGALFAVAGLAGCATLSGPRLGDPAPTFDVVDRQGRHWTPVDSAAKPLLVDLWATWCAPCIESLPGLKGFHQAHGDKIQVLGIAVDTQGWSVVEPVLKRHELGYPVALSTPALNQAYGFVGYPATFLLHQGKLVLRLKQGRHTQASLEKALAAYLK